MSRPLITVAGALRGTLRRAPRRVLGLDFDGTLAPFCSQRMEARPYPGVVPLLETIRAQGDTLAFFSGRPVTEVRQLLGPLGELCPIFGCHGGEDGWPGDAPQSRPLPLHVQQGLETAACVLRDHWQRRYPGAPCPLERKHGALAFHTRAHPCAAAEEPFCRNLWSHVARNTGLRFTPFDGGWELRYDRFNKGEALERFLADLGEPAFVVYLGDDLTDEDAFAVVASHGLGVLVRSRWRPTRAAAWCAPPEEILQFLALWGNVGKGAR